MTPVNFILRTKGNAVLTVSYNTIVFDAIEHMCKKNVGSVVVLENERVVGIFTEKDYACKLILTKRSCEQTVIGDVMTRDIITVTPQTGISECMEIMTKNFIRHLPVVDGDTLVGIISIGDVVKYLLEEQQFIIENMEHYITGT